MLKPLLSACLVLLKLGKPVLRHPLKEGTVVIGRDQDCDIVLAHESVSRRHAEITLAANGARLRDLGSRNGTSVNGVPRKTALLQEGDKIKLGSVELLFSMAAPVAAAPQLDLAATPEDRLHETQKAALRLPEARVERHLAAFYHLCAWVTDGVDESNGLVKWLELLVEALHGQAIQLYGQTSQLEQFIVREGERPKLKFAAFLLERFHALAEAAYYAPRDLDRYQERSGQFHFLVAPLRPAAQPARGACPVVVVLRPAGWEPFSPDDRVLAQSACQLWLRSTQKAREVQALRQENEELRQQQVAAANHGLLGESAVMRKLRAQLDRVAATKATVLIAGETGSGKEVVAHYLHQRSPRVAAPFIKLNCGAIPAGLIESELFGHVRGAFTDARSDHQGKFSLAHGGTLFLDEVGELPHSAQSKLLRALESGEIEPIGSERTTRVDVRVMAATNRSLAAMVKTREFREDLFYRLNVVAVAVPPLREHRDDVPGLAAHFLGQFCAENGLAELTLGPDALKALQAHRWPGNVRELRNAVQRVAIEAGAGAIRAAEVNKVLR